MLQINQTIKQALCLVKQNIQKNVTLQINKVLWLKFQNIFCTNSFFFLNKNTSIYFKEWGFLFRFKSSQNIIYPMWHSGIKKTWKLNFLTHMTILPDTVKVVVKWQ